MFFSTVRRFRLSLSFPQKLNHGQDNPAPNFIYHSVSGYYTAVFDGLFALTNTLFQNLTMVQFLGLSAGLPYSSSSDEDNASREAQPTVALLYLDSPNGALDSGSWASRPNRARNFVP